MPTNESYKLIVKFDDAELNAQIDKIKGAFGNLGGTKTGAKGSEENDPVKNLAHLAGMAVGVTGILILVKKITSAIVQASPNLQAILDLMNNAFMLVIRPFGDFLAMVLRPIMIALLTKFILPWYQINGSKFIEAGQRGGEVLENVLFPEEEIDWGKQFMDWAFGGFSKGVVDWFNDPNNLLPSAMADDGTDIAKKVGNQLNILDQALVDVKDFIRRFGETTEEEQKARDNSTTVGRIRQQEAKQTKNQRKGLDQSTIDALLRRGITEEQIREKFPNDSFAGTSIYKSKSTTPNKTVGRFGSNTLYGKKEVAITINTDSRIDEAFKTELTKVVKTVVEKHGRTTFNRGSSK